MNSDWLRDKRERLGLSQDELAAKFQAEGLNVSRSAISSWELGRNSSPIDNAHDLVLFAKVLGVSINDLLNVAGIEITGNVRSDAARYGAMIIDRLPPDAQRAAVD